MTPKPALKLLPPQEACYDCGSTIPRRHTKSCDMYDEGDVCDLPEEPGTQCWTGEVPTEA